MRVLTLTQPWASLVALGAKRIETRGWSTNYRGPLAIHAGAGLGPVGGPIGLLRLLDNEPFLSALLPAYGHTHGHRCIDTHRLPYGAIVAVVTLVDCRPHDADKDPEFNTHYSVGYRDAHGQYVAVSSHEEAFGQWAPSRYAWLLADVRPLREPVPCRGAQGLRSLPDDVAAAVVGQLGR